MVNRLARIGLAALLTTALAGHGPAWAQKDRKDRDKQEEEEEDELGDDTDPCKGVEPACGETEEDEDEGGGGKSKRSKKGDGEELAAGEGEGEGEGEGKGGGDDEGEAEGKSGGGDEGEGEASAAAEADADATIEAAPMGSNVGQGKLAINAGFKVGLSKGSTGDPISIEPDVWYGINPKLTAGIVTSSQAQTGFWGGAGKGICAVGDLCGNAFDNVGGEALYALKNDPSFVFALDVGFHALAIDGTVLAAKVGGKGIWRSGNLSVGFAPNIFIGVTKRDVNKERFNIPVDLSLMVSPKLSVGVQTGVTDTFSGAGDNYTVPVALGGYLIISEKLSASAAFSFDRVTSGGEGNGIDARSLSFVLGYLM
jgi:hypothetical protein